MAYDPTDAVTARALLERAVQWEDAPALTSAEVDSLMDLAETDGEYAASDLNGAAATGWGWKAGKVAGDFALSLEGGVKFNRDQVYAHCLGMVDAYLSGRASVIGTPRRRGTIASIGVTAELPEVS
jgi:hypothetical protein